MKKRRFILVISILLVLGIIVWLLLWMGGPSESSVSSVTPKVTRTESTLHDKHLDGKYISFQYSGKYVAGNNTPSNNDLERYTLSAGTNYDKRILASVVNLPDGRLESNGDYIYRQKTPSLYTKRQLSTSFGNFDVWVKQDGAEQTAMLARGDMAIIISFLTTPGVQDNLAPEVDAVIKTLRWKQ